MVKISIKKVSKVSKVLCIFCYKSFEEDSQDSDRDANDNASDISKSDVSHEEKLKICDKFYYQLHENKNVETKEEEQEKAGTSSCPKYAASWKSDKISVCSDCFYAVKTHARLFEKVAKLKRRLTWNLDKLYNVIKCASKIPSRVQDFQDNLKEDQDKNSVEEFRQQVFRTCRQKLKTSTGGVFNQTGSEVTSGTSQDPQYIKQETSDETETGSSVGSPLHAEVSEDGRGTRDSQASVPITESNLIYKCYKCPNTFPSPEALMSHAKENGHWILKEESGVSNTDVNEGLVLQCTVEITTGSTEEQRKLDEYLESDSLNDSFSSYSDSDSEVRKNTPALRRIIKKLRPHGAARYNENTPNDEESSSRIMKRKKLVPPKPRGRKKKQKCSVMCEICGKEFTGHTMAIAETMLFKHLKRTNLHDGKATWKHACQVCNKLCRYESTLEVHYEKAHSKDARK